MTGVDAVQLLADRQAIHDVVMRYAAGVDRRDMAMVRSCFAPDLEVVGWGGGDVVDRESMIRYISGVAVFHTTMHMFGNEFVEVDGDRAHLDSYAMLTHHRDGEDGQPSELNSSGARYVETLERRGGEWLVTRRGGDPIWAPTGVTQARSDDPAVRWLLDRAEIHDLLVQYALGVDLRDYERVRQCFATEFRAVYGDREFRDADDLVEFVRGVEHFESTTHFLGSQLIEVDVGAGEAWQRAYSLVTHRPGGGGTEWVLAGRYTDRLVREDGRWRIAERGPSAADGCLGGDGRRAVPHSEDPRVQALIDRAAIRDAIVRSALALDEADGRTQRLLNNDVVRIDGDHAQAETYLYLTTRGEDGRPSPWSQGARRWVDELRRGRAGWEIVARREDDTRVPDELVISPAEAATRVTRRGGA